MKYKVIIHKVEAAKLQYKEINFNICRLYPLYSVVYFTNFIYIYLYSFYIVSY